MGRRIATVVAVTSLSVAVILWGTRSPTVEAPTVPSPSVRAVAPVPAQAADPPAESWPEDERDTQAVVSSRSSSRRLQRLERRRAEAWQRVDDMVADGELSEEEAEELWAITQGTFSRAERLVEQRDAGEIGVIGVLVKSIPVRIVHVSQMASALGRERAREVRRSWRSRRRAEAE